MKTIKYSKLLLKTAILTSIGYSCFAQTSDTTFVNFNITYQVIDGFGASSASGRDEFNDTIVANMADLFFSSTKGIGLSLLRSQISPYGTPAISELYAMRSAVARGVTVWSTPWTPPGIWKSNDTTINGGYLLPQYYPDYAGQFARYVAAMKDSGVNIYAISIQNEPNQVASYWSCTWDDSEMHAFIPFLYDSLQSRGVGSTQILAGEESCWFLSYVGEIISDPITEPMLGICASHDYCFADPPTPLSTDGKHEWETEVSNTASPFDSSISDALGWANIISQFMTDANANAFHYWWLVSHNPDNEGLTNTAGNPAKRMYALGNFSKFVRPGYLRADDSLGPSGVVLSAYEDTVNGAFAIVAINNDSTATPIVVSLNGLSASYVTPWITSGTLDLIQQQNVAVSNSSFSYSLPDSSITTFVYTGTTTAIKPVNVISNNISIYPNPAQNEITITGLDASLKNQIVRVYSSIGQLIYENEISGTTRYTLNLAGYAPGMYCIVISNAQGQVVKKVMIAK